MKKVLSLVLAMAMIFALSISAFAEEATPVNNADNATGTQTINVQATRNNGTAGTDSIVNRYYVVVAWTITQPSYTAAGAAGTTYTWDGYRQKYITASVASPASSTDGFASVTVTNKSDLAIKASAAYAAANTNGTTWDNSDGEQTIAAVAGTGTLAAAKADQDYSNVTPANHEFSGAVALNGHTPAENDEVLGTITVTIAAA